MDWPVVSANALAMLQLTVAPAAAIVAALGTVALTNKRSAKTAEQQRTESRRDAARGLMVELIHSGQRWAQAILSMTVVASAHVQDGGDPSDITNGDRGQEAWALKTRLDMAFTEILLRVEPGELRSSIESLRSTMDRSSSFTGPPFLLFLGQQPMTQDQQRDLFKYVESFKQDIRTTERVAVTYFTGPIF